jgi:C-terminal processing protease CtpA/Prc
MTLFSVYLSTLSKLLDLLHQVGILFSEKQDPIRSQTNPNGFYEIYVKGIYQGSPADRSGVITEGDTLLEVNGENVRGLSLQTVAPMITGPLNTPVQLGLKPGKEAREAGLERLQHHAASPL